MNLTLQLNCKVLSAVVFLANALAVPASASDYNLRGYGRVSSAPVASEGVKGFVYTCDSTLHAVRLRQKLGRDLEQSATVAATWSSVSIGGRNFAVLTRPGLGSFLFCSKDAIVFALSAGSADAFGGAASLLSGAEGYAAVPADFTYLDKFDHTGIGSWYPSYWGDAYTKGHTNTIDDHFAFARSQSLSVQPNDGGPLLENLLPKIHEYELPYHFARWNDWTPSLALLKPEELFTPSTWQSYGANYYGQVSFGASALDAYRNWQEQEVMRQHVHDPLLVDWLDPNGEVDATAWMITRDSSETNRLNFVRYLRDVKGYTPAILGKAWYGDGAHFGSWNAVHLANGCDFYGIRSDDPIARRQWRLHTGSLDDGLKLGYQNVSCTDSAWPSFALRGGEIAGIEWRSTKSTWYRGTIDVPAAWLNAHKKAGRIYLNTVAMTRSGGYTRPDRVWVNGIEAGTHWLAPGMSMYGQLDVTAIVHPGANSVVYLPANNDCDAGFSGIAAFTSSRMESYPFSDALLNARYNDWMGFAAWAPLQRVENTLKAIRGIDPDRPIKVHAAENKDLFQPMIAKYGAYPHNTGEGGFLRAWDKRLGYPWGIPASAEFGGPFEKAEDADGLRRWIGFFSFEGLNAFDQFHNIQDMMYHPGLNEIWAKYMPYLHLANRWDIRKPDIAIFWSSANSRLLPRSLPYAFDLGRGDLQSIGYSYIYIDEGSLAAGLAKDYPVLWDDGTRIMSPETVAQIAKYVKDGGTYVAIQDTGRDTYAQPNAWPISRLTGFKVAGIRPMSGTITIMKSQSLFATLAGHNIYNSGRSTDYSNYNFADKCLTLEPVASGTSVVARYEDGRIAIGMRKVGKGRVVVIGSPFWRDSFDKMGYWHPGEGQCAFLEDMLHGLGLSPMSASANHNVWREHYVADNGTEEYFVMWNSTDQSQTADFTWQTNHPATSLLDPKDGSVHAATVTGNTVTTNGVTLAPYETLILATQPIRPVSDTIGDWFSHLSLWWRTSAPGAVVQRPASLPVDETPLELVRSRVVPDAQIASYLTGGAIESNADWSAFGYIKPENAGLKPADTDHVVYFGSVDAPSSWKADATYQIEFKPVYATDYAKLSVVLNGARLDDVNVSNRSIYRVNATRHVLVGKRNELVIIAPKCGYLGAVVIERQPRASSAIEVKGRFDVQGTEDSGVSYVTLPGKFNGLFAVKHDVAIPMSWRGSRVYIRLNLKGEGQFNAFAINEKVVFTPVSWSAPVTYMDITPWVKFGQSNSLLLLPSHAAQSWTPGDLGVDKIVLERVAAGDR